MENTSFSGRSHLNSCVESLITLRPGSSNRDILQKPRMCYTGQMVRTKAEGLQGSSSRSFTFRRTWNVILGWLVVRARTVSNRERRNERNTEPIQLEREPQPPLR